jgi:Arc/MetJ-type ribon-helix-helix transcriptional regulator
MFKSKTKMISFRLCEDEFLEFRRICLEEGFASFSDLVRAAVQQLLAKRAQQREASLQAAVEQIQSRMDELDRDLKQLLGIWPAVSR